MDEASEGVVVFSWGFSGFQSGRIPHAIVINLLQAFGNLTQKVVMKFDPEFLPYIPENVMPSVWIPQQDLLGKF